MPRTKLPRGSVPVTFRFPQQAQKILTAKTRRDKVGVSKLVRRALLERALKKFLSGDDALGLLRFVNFPSPRGSHLLAPSLFSSDRAQRAPVCTRLARFFEAAPIIFSDE